MALVAVLWMVAALSIIVTGISSAVRNEIRLVSSAQQTVKANALGIAAVQLVLQQIAGKQGLFAQPAQLSQLSQVRVQYQNTPVGVTVVPLSGLIDINNAPVPLLAALFSVAGGRDTASAEALAQAAFDNRTAKDQMGAAQGFEATDDLLRVPGFDYNLYAKISGLITADQRGSGLVNPLAAPAGVLLVLADGNTAIANKIAADRGAGQTGIDTTRLNSAYIDTGSTQRFLLQARVPLADGTWLVVIRGVDLGGGKREGFPWRTFKSEHRAEAASPAA